MLIDIVIDVLKELKIDCQSRVHKLRSKEHSVVQREINLLDYYYSSASRQEKEVIWQAPRTDQTLINSASTIKRMGVFLSLRLWGMETIPYSCT
jgi:hypothetical protein